MTHAAAPVPQPGLPLPGGPHPVGRTALDLLDRSRHDPYVGRGRKHRSLVIWLWYPAVPGTGLRPSRYMPGLWRANTALFGIRAGRVRVHSSDHALPAAARGDGFPLVVLSPSVNPPLAYAGLAEDLASHGFVVAGVAHTYATLPLSVPARGLPRVFRPRATGGAFNAAGSRPYERDLAERAAVVDVMADDVEFVAREVRSRDGAWGRVDAGRWAALGHSFGGAAAVEAARRDASCRAAVNLDGGLWQEPSTLGVHGPVLQLFGEHPEYAATPAQAVARRFFVDEEYAATDQAFAVGAWDALHRNARPGHTAVVRGATHTSFQDWPMLPTRRWSIARRSLGNRTGPSACSTVSRVVRCFLDRYVCDQPVDVDTVMRTDETLRTGVPAALFARTMEASLS